VEFSFPAYADDTSSIRRILSLQMRGRPGTIHYLTHMHELCILMHMRSTLNIDDEMLRRAGDLTGEKEKTALVRMGLEALIARESARRLAKLGGTEPKLSPIRRRRTHPTK
jgi:hypothetical protein